MANQSGLGGKIIDSMQQIYEFIERKFLELNNKKVDRAGDTMTGDLNFSGNNIRVLAGNNFTIGASGGVGLMMATGLTPSTDQMRINSSTGMMYVIQAPTASAPSYVKGGMYFDTTLNKLRVGGATAWETVTSA